MELFFVHEFAWSNRASTKIDYDSKTQIISKCLHDSYSFKTRNAYQESSKDAWPILQSKFNSRE